MEGGIVLQCCYMGYMFQSSFANGIVPIDRLIAPTSLLLKQTLLPPIIIGIWWSNMFILFISDMWLSDTDCKPMAPASQPSQTDSIVHLGAVVNVNFRFRAKRLFYLNCWISYNIIDTFPLGAIMLNLNCIQEIQQSTGSKQQPQNNFHIERNDHVIYLHDRQVLLSLNNDNNQWVAVANCQIILKHEGLSNY